MYPQHPCAETDEWKKYNINGQLQIIETYPTEYIADGVRAFRGGRSRTVFAYLCPPNPHEPYGIQDAYSAAPVGEWDGSPATREDTPGKKADKPRYIRDSSATFDQGQRLRKKQLRSLMSVDDMVDAIFEKLESNDQIERTLAFLLADNGMLGSEQTWLKKRVPYEHAIRIPFFVRGAGFAPGTRSEKLVANIDVAPTDYRAAGIETPPTVDGRALQDDFKRGHILVQFFTEGKRIPTWALVVTRSAKYTEYYEEAAAASFTENYDLNSDPWELNNREEPPAAKPFVAQLALDRGSAPPVPDGSSGTGSQIETSVSDPGANRALSALTPKEMPPQGLSPRQQASPRQRRGCGCRS
jgi:arylsulfatase A-like enzyme